MPTLGSSSSPQDNVALENEVYTQVFDPYKYGRVLGYGYGMTKSRLPSYGLVTRVEQVVQEKALLEEAKSQFHVEVVERNARLIAEAKERIFDVMGNKLPTHSLNAITK
ncbi:hypothetical protein PVK06_027846 [Gossypium arboreum]|uniref:Uncharacterized protein n=1 Tax=Gossypium arboreum TaxID=29729 RepID=A0ABR0P1D3_GOSAR|nr:hypothetical protein PVK06_027846 [Gossypium arboreum]